MIWASVTAVGPLRIQLDGDTAPLSITPDSLIDPASLVVTDRVRVEITQNRVVVVGRAGGLVLPTGSTTVAGIVPLATDAQAVAGTDTSHAVTPHGLAAVTLTGRVVRSSTTPALNASTYTDLSTNANWSTTTPAAQNVGFAAYSNGWTIPAAGTYRVSLSLVNVANIGMVAGVTVNKSSSVAYTDLFGTVAAAPAGGLAGATTSFEQHFATSDVLRPFAISASGTPALSASLGAFTVTWVRS